MSGWIYYARVWRTFLANAFIRELQFRSNFVTTLITRGFWFGVQLVLFDLIYKEVPLINDWDRAQYFGFMATGMLINSLVEMFFMTNCAQVGEQIRTGDLDFALVKPIDTQFLVSCEKIELPMLSQVAMALGLLIYSIRETGRVVQPLEIAVYAALIVAAVTFFYSLMIALACTSIWFGRNQGLLEFWFYITIFARYPGSIYSGSPTGEIIRFAFSYVIPILLVVTVPARWVMAMVIEPNWLTGLTFVASAAMFLAARAVFHWSLRYYRSASS
jgi:ABC-2 type transport system permease protein